MPINLFENSSGLVVISIMAIIAISIAILLMSYKKAKQGQALIRNGLGGTKVSFNSIIALPFVHKLESIDLRVSTLSINMKGKQSLAFNQGKTAEFEFKFYFSITPLKESVLRVAHTVGCSQALSEETLSQLFEDKFRLTIRQVASQFDLEEIFTFQDTFCNQVIASIDHQLNGYRLDDMTFKILK